MTTIDSSELDRSEVRATLDVRVTRAKALVRAEFAELEQHLPGRTAREIADRLERGYIEQIEAGAELGRRVLDQAERIDEAMREVFGEGVGSA